jgi:adenylate cyclase
VSHLEIEKRYLVRSGNIVKILENDFVDYTTLDIEQFYLLATMDKTLRYRKEGERYIRNSKKGAGLVREEREEEVTEKEYKEAKSKNSGAIIKKVRYKFEINGYCFELDVFKGALKALRILEIEFPDIETAKRFKMPEILNPLIIREITNEAIYSNGALSRSNKIPLREDSKLSFNEIVTSNAIEKPKFNIYISEYENASLALENTLQRLFLTFKLQIGLFLERANLYHVKVAHKALYRYRSLLKGFKKYIDSKSYDEKLFALDSLILIFDKSFNIAKSFKELLACKREFSKEVQNEVLKTLIDLARLKREEKERLLNLNLSVRVDNFDRIPLKYKKSFKKPFEYIAFKVKEKNLSILKKSIKKDDNLTLFFKLKRYKHLMEFFKEEFSRKGYKKLKKALIIEHSKKFIANENSKVAEKFYKLCAPKEKTKRIRKKLF